MSKRSNSSAAWLQEHHKDQYVIRSQKDGYRSRAAYKLEEINDRDRLLKQASVVVDLGAAPGGWSQYAGRLMQGNVRIIANDILEMEELPGVEFVLGDFREDVVFDGLMRQINQSDDASNKRIVDLVMSDMAPNTSGNKAMDQPRMMHLAELARDLSLEVLKPGGSFLVKLFQGEGFQEYLATLRAEFQQVVTRKPAASRSRSSELYLLAKGRK
jgi:23S rRNA (uridine2552-2'-O)-methyltransferase